MAQIDLPAKRVNFWLCYIMSIFLISLAIYILTKLKKHPFYHLLPKFANKIFELILVLNVLIIVFQIADTLNQASFSFVYVTLFSACIACQLGIIAHTYWLVGVTYYRASIQLPGEEAPEASLAWLKNGDKIVGWGIIVLSVYLFVAFFV